MGQNTTTTAREVTGPELLGQLTSRQADLLSAKFHAAYVAVSVLEDGAGFRAPEWGSLDALWDDLHGLAADANAAEWAIHCRETDPGLIAAARRSNHLYAIAKAEQLLAAERTPGRVVTAPVQPVTLTPADLTAIRTSLIEKVHALRNHADHARGHGNSDRAVMREQAARYEDLAARLSFAVPGEPIQVVDA